MKLIKILLSMFALGATAATVFGQGTPGVGTGGSGQSSETLQATNGATFTNLDGGIYYAIEPLSQ